MVCVFFSFLQGTCVSKFHGFWPNEAYASLKLTFSNKERKTTTSKFLTFATILSHPFVSTPLSGKMSNCACDATHVTDHRDAGSHF